MAVLTFTQLAGQYDPAIAAGVNSVLANAVAGNADTVTEALTLYVIIVGGMMCFRELSWGDFVKHALRAAAIATLMTYTAFNTLIAQPAMVTIPNWIAQTVNSQASVNSAPQQFDLIWSGTKHQEAAVLQQATGLENIGYQVEARFYTMLAGFLLTVCFWCYEFSRAVMGLIVCVLPFVLFLYLFESTRGIPQRVFEKGVGILILQLLLSITIQLMLKGDSYILVTAYQTGGASLDAQLGAFEDLLVFFAFGTGLVIFIPSIASYIGGGIALNVGGPMMNAARSMIPVAGRGIGAAGRAGRGAIRRVSGR